MQSVKHVVDSAGGLHRVHPPSQYPHSARHVHQKMMSEVMIPILSGGGFEDPLH